MWQLVLADRAGALLGEVTDAHDRQFNLGLSTLNSGSFKVSAEHPLANTLVNANSLVLLYSKAGSAASVLRMVAELVTVEEVASDAGSTIAVTFAEAGYYRLQHRIIGRTAAGYSNGTAALQVNRSVIAAAIIDLANADGATGVTKGTMTSSGTTAIGPWRYKQVMEALTELAFASDGYDYVFDPVDPSTGNVASFRCAATIGTTKPNAVFEYGTGQRNVSSFKRQVSRDSLLNLAYVMPGGFPDNTADTVSSATDATSVTTYGTWQGVISTDLTTAAARNALATQHVTLRKAPRQRIEFVPGPSAPVYGTDYSIGDTVTARAENPANAIRFNAAFRVYGVSVALTDEGLEQLTLTLIAD